MNVPIAGFHVINHAVPTCSLSSFHPRRPHCTRRSSIELSLVGSPPIFTFLCSRFKASSCVSCSHSYSFPLLGDGSHLLHVLIIVLYSSCPLPSSLLPLASCLLPLASCHPIAPLFPPASLLPNPPRILLMYNFWKLAQIIASHLLEGSLRRLQVSPYQPSCRFSDFLIWWVYLSFNCILSS